MYNVSNILVKFIYCYLLCYTSTHKFCMYVCLKMLAKKLVYISMKTGWLTKYAYILVYII